MIQSPESSAPKFAPPPRSPQYGSGVVGPLSSNIAPLHMAVDKQLQQAVQQAQDEHPDFNPLSWDVTFCWFLHRKGDSPY